MIIIALYGNGRNEPQPCTPAFYYHMVMNEQLSKHPIKAHQQKRLQKIMHRLFSCVRAADSPAHFQLLVPMMLKVAKLMKQIRSVMWKCDFILQYHLN